MDTLQLCVEDQENAEFKQTNRPIWPRIPTACTVQQCNKETLNKNFNDFIIHWKNHHTVSKKVKQCSCGRIFSVAKHLKQHLKLKPEHHAMADKLIDCQDYIDPGDQLPYQLGDKEDRTHMKDLQKQLASQKRKMEADKFSDKRDLLTSISTVNVCRDERIVERKGILYKDTNMWD